MAKEDEEKFTDERLEWLKDMLFLGLSLKDIPHDQLVQVLTHYQLGDFLNGKTNHTTLVFSAVERYETIQNEEDQEEEEENKESEEKNEEGNTEETGEEKKDEDGETAAAEEKAEEEKKEDPAAGGEEEKGENNQEEEQKIEEEEETPQNEPIELHVTDLNLYFNEIPSLPSEARVMAFYSLIGPKRAIPRDRNKIDKCFAYQVIPGNCLEGLSLSLNSVYKHIFCTQCDSAPENPESDPLASGVDADFLSVFNKFVDEVNHSVTKLQTVHDISFPTPPQGDPKRLAQNEQYTAQLEQVLDQFTSLVSRTIDQLTKQQPASPGPLAEVELWRSRYIVSSSLLEQLRSPHLPEIIAVLDEINSQSVPNFNAQLEDLDRYVKEAKSNVDFLSLLERHFKNLETCPLDVIFNSIPSIMDSLRLIWITSNYYNTDVLMSPLIERISQQLSDRVQAEIKTSLLHGPLDVAIKKTKVAYNVLSHWHDRFHDTRVEIEKKPHIPRWDFEVQRLFERPLYIADRCKELIMIAQKLQELYLILGPELKSVTSNPRVIDETRAQVDALITPLDPLPFEIFDKRLRAPWEAVLSRFLTGEHKIQEQLTDLINTSFKDLRSSEAGLDLLDRFRKIQLAGEMKAQMDGKYADVLARYSDEVTAIEELYNTHWPNPPILSHHPPVTGKISWSRSLFIRMKKPILRLRLHPQITNAPEYKGVKDHYTKVAKLIDKNNQLVFQEWNSRVSAIASAALSKPILSVSKGMLFDTEIANHSVNFDPLLQTQIDEGKHLERMGYVLDHEFINVLLQYPSYRKLQRKLEGMLSGWRSTLSSLKKDEVPILAGCIQLVEEAFSDGSTYLNWNSLGSSKFLELSISAISKFNSAANSIASNAEKIHAAVAKIGKCETVPPASALEGITKIDDFSDFLVNYHSDKQKEILSQFLEVSPQLRIIEGNAFPSSDHHHSVDKVRGKGKGRDPHVMIQKALSSYYKLWEGRIFNALTLSTLNSLIRFKQLMEKSGFQIEARLAPPKIVYQPTFETITNVITKLVKMVINTSNVCLQWKEGTCIVPLQQQTSDDNEVELKHYGMKVVKVSEIIRRQEEILELTKIFCKRVESVEQIFSPFTSVWMDDRKQIVEQFKLENPTIADFDSRLSHYHNLMDQVRSLIDQNGHFVFEVGLLKNENGHNVDQYQRLINEDGFLVDENDRRIDVFGRHVNEKGDPITEDGVPIYDIIEPTEKPLIILATVNYTPIVDSITSECTTWVSSYGTAMSEILNEQVQEMNNMLTKTLADIQKEVKERQDLEFVLSTIQTAHDNHANVERSRKDIKELARTLKCYKLPLPEGSEEIISKFKERWKEILDKSKARDEELVEIKRKFTLLTKDESAEFVKIVSEFEQRFVNNGPGSESTKMDEGLELVVAFKQELKQLCTRRDEINVAELLFGLDKTPFSQLQVIEKSLESLNKIYTLYDKQRKTMDEWSEMQWSDVKITMLEEGIQGFQDAFVRLEPSIRKLPPGVQIKKELDDFRTSLPLFQDLKSEALRDRHWNEMMVRTGASFDISSGGVTLGNIFKMNLLQYSDVISEISGNAQKELSIEKGISEIADTWNKIRFTVHVYKRSPTATEERGYILSGIDEILTVLDDNKMRLQTLSSSRFVGFFQRLVREWEILLSQIGDLVSIWLQVQLKWMYLESIFIGSEDIKQQLPEEAAIFKGIDDKWNKLMQETRKNTLIITAAKTPDRLVTLQTLAQTLDKCQRSLSDYLETKRVAFPRFFFISDDELLSILGSGDPTSVQQHMIKLFDNCESLQFKSSRGSTNATGMVSSEKESYEFKTPVACEGAVEDWMSAIEQEMKSTLHQVMKESVITYPRNKRTDWILQYIGMCVLMVSQIWWTYEVEDSFRQVRTGNKQAMKEMRSKLVKQLTDIVALVRSDIDRLSRKKINTLIIVDVHARDLVDGFVRDSILDAREFQWESQLRFYWDRATDDVSIRQCTGTFQTAYEYMGLNGRLVITPLTDRCIMTLTQALSMGFGGSPAGPAGTGKTETVKDLAKAMCRLCNVFNCGEGLDHKAMASIFSGLVQTGGWGCFDEFNRIEAEVLSVISGHIRVIQSAAKAGVRQFVFEGRKIPLNPGFGIFITMNPGYAGRSELPDNLKAMFRPVVMVVPDKELICEVMLFSEGFETNTHMLAKKMITIYDMASGQLSKQHHYDWGLRAIKSILTRAGELKRANTEIREELVLMTAIRDMNMPKFVFEDAPLFVGLLKDLFPDIELDPIHHPTLSEKIDEIFEEMGYSKIPEEMDKVVQLHETMVTRHTTMVVGGTCGGKSVVIDVLAKAQNRLGTLTRIYTMNPKACTVPELYGVLDPTTRDWKWGLFSKIFKNINQATDKKEARYILFDGDVDAVWVENMNSVMDDNKLLTLANSERIRLMPHCALLFEVGNLQYASPATVSRCGMVFMDPRNLGFVPYYERWLRLNKRPETQMLAGLFERYVTPCINFINGKVADSTTSQPLETIIPVTGLSMTRSLCTILAALLPPDTQEIKEAEVLESLFIFAVMWSLGGALTDESMLKFDQFVKILSNWVIIDAPGRFAKAGQLPGTEPTLYEFEFNLEQQQWIPWSEKIGGYEVPMNVPFNQIIVPTIDTVRNQFLLKTIVTIARQPVLFCGKSGTAKTASITDLMSNLDQDVYMCRTLNFSNCTTSLDVQNSLEENLDCPTKDTAIPQGGKEMILFIDDVNMPTVDIYGTQQPIALLKLLIDKGGMYERGGDLIWKSVHKVQYISAMAPPGGARAMLDPRFTSLFNVIHVVSPSDESLHHIFNTILGNHTKNFADEIKNAHKTITDTTIKFFEDVVAKLPPTPSKFHYIFNLRDLSRVFEGLCKSTPSKYQTIGDFIRLWRNECLRVFHDRLTNMDDRNFVMGKVESFIEANFPGAREQAISDPSLFGDFVSESGSTEGPFLYKDLDTYESLMQHFSDVLEDYSIVKKSRSSIVLFNYVVEHLTRILRIIRTPRGNALLIGIGGSGKKSLTRVAAFAAGYEVFEITLTRTYNEDDFREELRRLYKMVGVERKQVVFLFSDSHIVNEGFLEIVNNMLTSGIVPALFGPDDKETFSASVKEDVQRMGLLDSPENCWRVFIDRCRDNLHIVLCFSPSGDSLRRRCRDFPGLVNNTVIDWFDPWPEEALSAVSKHFLEEESALIPENLFPSIVANMVITHQQCVKASSTFSHIARRPVHVTPTNFLDFISTFRNLLSSKNQYIKQQIQTLADGLARIESATKEVEELDVKFKSQQATLLMVEEENKKKLETAEAARTMAQDLMGKATIKKAENEEQLKAITEAKEEADRALSEARPILEAAEKAASEINQQEYASFKSMAKPSAAGQDIGNLICALFNDSPGQESWDKAKQYMADPAFLRKMATYNVRERCRNKRKMDRVGQILDQLKKDPERIKKAGVAISQIFNWTDNIYKYYLADNKIKPLEDEAARKQEELDQSIAELKALEESLVRYQAEEAQATKELEEGEKRQQELQKQKDILEARLDAARRLTSGFSSEKVRWAEDMEMYKHQLERLIGDSVLGAAFLCYLGPLNQEYRQTLLNDTFKADLVERGVPVTPDFTLSEFLADEAEIFGWRGEGLPADELSIQNGLLITRANRFPLCIDPQLQVVRWIKQHIGEKTLRTTNFQDPEFARILENALQFGLVVLFEGIDEIIDPLVTPILEKQIIQQGSRKVIKFNDKELDYDDNFKLFMTTKLTSPNYSPEVSSRVALVNCCVTEQGLQEQLLDIVIENEQTALHQKKTNLVKETSENKRRLQTLQRTLLKLLSESTGYITDNAQLLATLEETKTEAADIANKLEVAQKTTVELDQLYNEYLPVARRGSVLFFSMNNLSAINAMYEYSLSSFSEVFLNSLKRSSPTTVISKRINNILGVLTFDVFEYVLTGLFERHKLMYAFHMALSIAREKGNVDPDTLDFLLKGNISLEKSAQENPFPSWFPEQGWQDMQKIITVNEAFAGLLDSFVENEEVWKAYYNDVTPEHATIPMGYEDKLDALQKMAVLRCFRPDRLFLAARRYVLDTLGNQYSKFPIVNYQSLFDQSSPSAPVLFILSPGADPASELYKLADKLGLTGDESGTGGAGARQNNVKSIALGQDQEEPARQMLAAGASKGHWVILQNCHLLTSWLRELEKLVEKYTLRPNPQFRLWMTSDPTNKFPVGLLQRAHKVVTEPPSGLQLNMQQSFSTISEEQFEECPHEAFQPLVYVLAFFHAVVQERRKYGKIGWNVAYDFNLSDFTVSMKLIGTYLTKAFDNKDTIIPWGSLRYLVGEAMYGGRVTDDFDRRILMTYLDEYMGDFLFDKFQVFHFFENDTQSYELPSAQGRQEYVTAIDTLPAITSPDVFGLNVNAEITFYQDSSLEMCQNLQNIHSSSFSAAGGVSKEAQVASTVTEIQMKLKPPFNLNEVRASFGFETTPVQIVLLQELEHWNKLVNSMSTSLFELQRAIAGEVSMSNELEELMNAIYLGRLPTLWATKAPMTEKSLASWLVHFQRRYEQYEDWYKNGEPKVMWLSGLHVPEAYLTALLQTACRSKGWPLDKATMMITVSSYTKESQVTQKPALGCYISGMYLEGASWDTDKKCLIPQRPKELVMELPLLKVTPIEMNKVRTQNMLCTPIYLTQKRRDAMGVGYVTSAYLETTEHRSFWILQGVAICMNIR